ncbi:LRIF1 factor, partial [Centropus unirufus]|nr:LRIF1 factor [Centropus unirufus]
SIAGCMYRVVQTTGPDGKNLLKLLPISKSTGSFVPIAPSSAIPNHSSPIHLTFKTHLANPTAPSAVKIPGFPSPHPGKLILTRTLEAQGSTRAGSGKESLVPRSAAGTQSSCVPMDGLSVQSMAVTSSSDKCHAAYVLVNSKSLPVPAKVPLLPSGHHLLIPADAEVKSVPASLLPRPIQQKILAAAATNAGEGDDSTKIPTVICVSPVNTVKMAFPKRLQPICPKPAVEASKTAMRAEQKGPDSPVMAASEGQQSQRTPMKWVVQESCQSTASCLIPVKSSNSVASRILKTLSDTKDGEVNSANILPVGSSGPGGSQTKITTFKDNALVMFNGKVYLLTKKGLDVPTAQADKQTPSSSDASLTKGTSNLIDLAADNETNHKVVNWVFSKPKGVALPQRDPNLDTSSSSSSPPAFTSAPTAPVTPSADQDSSVNQAKSLPFTESVSSAASPAPGGTQEDECQNSKEKIHSPKAAKAALPQPEPECASSEERQKIQCETMDPLENVTQVEHQEKPCHKEYLELRKKFGLSKEERVYLKRIPLRTSCEKPEERFCPRNRLDRRNYTWTSSSLDVKINEHQECVKGEKGTAALEGHLTKKRKTKTSALSNSRKRRKSSVQSSTTLSAETPSSGFALPSGVSPTPLSSQPCLPAASVLPSPRSDSEQGPFSPNSDGTDSGVPVVVSCEGHTSFLEGSFRDDAFLLTPPDLDETIRDERINRLKQLLREREAALEEMRRK